MGAPETEADPAVLEPAVVDWLAIDWGTSNLRAWAMTGAGEVLACRASEKGMGRLAPGEYPGVLSELIRGWTPRDPGRPLPVLICGMAGARQGWCEAPYLPVPTAPLGTGAVTPPDAPAGLAVRILPGLCQRAPRDEVMRGEETQIAGALARDPGFDGTICLPGTHCKWASVAGGAVTGFQSFLTGELFELLATRSVLRHGLAGAGEDPAAFDAAFGAAVGESLAEPGALPAGLFGIRAAGLLDGLAPDAGAGRLSGLLIGSELAACRPRWQDRPLVVIGAGRLSDLYAAALARAGAAEPKRLHATEATLAGLRAARALMELE
ncbi:2-dehydro-3-deoxygalactonokinase [Amaricoccus solimangrovi]|uniref:2-dehydro-3-deoxygalactonokinase n=1 Tax=Amaricoccus solimangrovi TaxID=2589815 RepID=A0A501WJD0_9RHOB|nr:2-dehydro-3-deoxygalactonokinase [Amaricoccus solimangrovi]TPE48535.1 2-dehydro-3-deoxygalactonokinase [Amaricoccus solimangrovi]